MNPWTLELCAFVSGTVVPIEAVPDPVFSEKMLGDGIAIDPSDNIVLAPCDGELIQVHKAGHAYGIQAPNGAKVLLHIGLESVKAGPAIFKPRVNQGQQVKAGQALVELDRDALTRLCSSPLAILVIENAEDFPITWRAEGTVTAGSSLLLHLGTQAPPAMATRLPADSVSRQAQVRHPEGLHARPAALVASLAKKFDADLEILFEGRRANAKSPVSLMGLAVTLGATVEVIASGTQAEQSLAAICEALETVAPESPAPGKAAHQKAPTAAVTPIPLSENLPEGTLAGLSASKGLAIGTAIHFQPSALFSEIPEAGVGTQIEEAKLAEALRTAIDDIEHARLKAASQDEKAIFEAHLVLIDDPELLANAAQLILTGKSAAFAWSTVLREQCRAFESSGSALLADRAADLRDLEHRVLTKLLGSAETSLQLPDKAILLCDELSPAILASLDKSCLVGLATERGGTLSHAAIIARSLKIPYLAAMGSALQIVPEGQKILLDAEAGRLFWKPAPEQLLACAARIEENHRRHALALSQAVAPATTADGYTLEVAANVNRSGEVDALASSGADGVGLLRTELFFVDRQSAPTALEQRDAYQRVLDALPGKRVIIRTLDVGADKSLDFLPLPHEDNPALGIRGIRLGLAQNGLLQEQLKACLALQPLSRVRIMLPMITELWELQETRELLQQLATEMGLSSLPELGIMIETPAAAVMADKLAPLADFFSIGANDLTQYVLAMDRCNPALATRLDPLQPAVLRMIESTCEGAKAGGTWVGICGEMAGDPLAIPVLLGLGVTELSVSPALIPETKAIVRQLNQKDCRTAAKQVLQCTAPQEVRAFIRQTWPWLAN